MVQIYNFKLFCVISYPRLIKINIICKTYNVC